MKGTISFLLSDSPEARLLRSQYVFKLVPMLNPDGVVYGNYRCCLLGYDLNRRWKAPSRLLQPTIFHAKQMVGLMAEERDIAMYYDLHAHSTQKNVFMYGCAFSPAEMDHIHKNAGIRVVPLLMAQRNPGFSYKFSRFGIEKCKEATARVVLFHEFHVTNSYTCESSFFGFELGFNCYDRSSESAGMMPLAEYERIGEQLCRVASIFLPSWHAKSRIYDITQRIAAALYEQYMRFMLPLAGAEAPHKTGDTAPDPDHAEVEAETEEQISEDATTVEEETKVDMEKLAEDVKAEIELEQRHTEDSKTSAVEPEDDDISSTDSEEARKISLIKQRLLRHRRKKKRSSKPKKPHHAKPGHKKRAQAPPSEPEEVAPPLPSASTTSHTGKAKAAANRFHEVELRTRPAVDKRKATLPANVAPAKAQGDSPLRIRRIITGGVMVGRMVMQTEGLPAVIMNGMREGKTAIPNAAKRTAVDLSLQGLRIKHFQSAERGAGGQSRGGKSKCIGAPMFEELFPKPFQAPTPPTKNKHEALSRHSRLVACSGESQNKSAFLEREEPEEEAPRMRERQTIARISRQVRVRPAVSGKFADGFRVLEEPTEQSLKRIQPTRVVYEVHRSRRLVGASMVANSDQTVPKFY